MLYSNYINKYIAKHVILIIVPVAFILCSYLFLNHDYNKFNSRTTSISEFIQQSYEVISINEKNNDPYDCNVVINNIYKLKKTFGNIKFATYKHIIHGGLGHLHERECFSLSKLLLPSNANWSDTLQAPESAFLLSKVIDKVTQTENVRVILKNNTHHLEIGLSQKLSDNILNNYDTRSVFSIDYDFQKWFDIEYFDVKLSIMPIKRLASGPYIDYKNLLVYLLLSLALSLSIAFFTYKALSRSQHFSTLLKRRLIYPYFSRYLKTKTITFNYQPIVDSQDNSIFAFEVLCRLGQSGAAPRCLQYLDAKTDFLLFKTAIISTVELIGDKLSSKVMYSFNLKPETIIEYLDDPFWSDIEYLIKSNGKKFILEITEDSLEQSEQDNLRHSLKKISQYGMELSIDDFGVGHSNLSRISELDIDCIKIDRSLIANIENSRPLLSLLTDYCDTKGIRIIAEGIESKSLINTLNTSSIFLHQGFIYSKAKPASYWIEYFSNKTKRISTE